jgi:AraC family transcriptional regulator of adaptative response / DNA-3-methyladenine glycosylase II
MGTPNTVLRALRLIDESGLEDGGVEVLAERLGVGSRHLRRLFLRHLGATPSAVAQTRRLQFAKKLIDETRLPMREIAMASGFGCVRRFNAAIRKIYHRTPTEIRDLARQTIAQPDNHYCFRLHYRPPYAWKGMLGFLAARAIPGIESVVDGKYSRSISVNGGHGYFEISHDEEQGDLSVRVQFGDPRALFFIIERIRAMFDLNADWTAIVESLRADPLLATRVDAEPGLRVPGCWSGFEIAVRAVLGQQFSAVAATALTGRVVSNFGQTFSAGKDLTHLFPLPEVLANARLTSVGIPKEEADTIRDLARAVCSRQLSFERSVEAEALLARLGEIPGFHKSTAQYIAMRALSEPDTIPTGDPGLLRGSGAENSNQLERRARAWRPWRAYAAMYLWSFAGDEAVCDDQSAAVPTLSIKESRTPQAVS